MADTTKMNPDYVGYSVKYEDLAYFKEKQDALNDKKVSDALTTAEGYTDTEVGKVATKVDTLIGSDANKSARTIANEELASQLIPESAKESLDTLKEIADWIQAHPDDAAAMNAAIEALQTLVGTLPEGITATTVVGYVTELVAAERTRADAEELSLLREIDNRYAGLSQDLNKAVENANKYADAKGDDANAYAAELVAAEKRRAEGEELSLLREIDNRCAGISQDIAGAIETANSYADARGADATTYANAYTDEAIERILNEGSDIDIKIEDGLTAYFETGAGKEMTDDIDTRFTALENEIPKTAIDALFTD